MNFDLALDFAFYSVNDLIFNSFCTFLQKKVKLVLSDTLY